MQPKQKMLSFLIKSTIFLWYSVAITSSKSHETKHSLQLTDPTSELTNLFWFVQVTDIHISKFSAFSRAPDLKKFCLTHITNIRPDFVIVSGDLTDAKYADKRGSKQFIEEWKLYQKTVNDCKQAYDTTWYDIKGNHDAFDVPGDFDKRNLFRKYSEQGWTHPSSYSFTHVKPYGNYSVIAMDAAPIPGPRRPFNFFGYMNKERRTKLQDLSQQAMNSSNMTLWFGHYTTSLIVDAEESNVRNLMKDAAYYLCGHLHTLNGLLTRMYTRHNTGTIELELGDWRDNRLYRVLAIDNDMLSFTDVKYGEWPVVLITNPKDALFTSSKEPTYRMKNSTYIRILVFSTAKIQSVDVYIDDKWIGLAHHVRGPLYALKWNPASYLHGLNTIKVTVQDSVNILKTVKQDFSLDGTVTSFSFLARMVLTNNIYYFTQCIFWMLILIYIVLLLMLRLLQNIQVMFIQGQNVITRNVGHFINIWLLRLWLVTKVKSLYWLFTLFTLYVAIGPWFIADVLEGEVGVLFVWGLYVKGTLLPGCLAYLYGTFHIVLFNIPLLLMTGYIIHYTRQMSQKHHIPRFHKLKHIYIPFLSLVIVNTLIAITEFPAAYGSKAMILGPVRTGSIFLSFVAYHLAQKHALAIPAFHKVDKD
ncbi:transmembrane protein 62-like [Mytilus trossulus]|uniref:transmembrane protein 62-like n=1 Tax=Mytilus trossulus TaxID=6551 RepID=UPI003003D5DA